MRRRERVNLYIRIERGGGKRAYVVPDLKKQRTAIIDGKPERHDEGVYYLRYEQDGRRRWEAVGNDLTMALTKRKMRDSELTLGFNSADIHRAIAKPQTTPVKKAPEARATLYELRERFTARKKIQRHDDGTPLDPETVTAYAQHTAELLAACERSGHQYPEELDGDDLRWFIETLHQKDLEHNSIVNRYTSIVAFMRFMKLDHKDEEKYLAKGERPRPRVFKPEAYSYAETDAFFAACDNERHALAFETFLKTGGRELEVAHLPWDDLDLGDAPHVTYTENTELNHNTKNRKSRSVPLEAGLAVNLREWRKKNPGTKLVFGTEADKVDWHFWRACKRIAEKAGFDPSNWWVHKFRDTFATRTLEKRPDLLRTLQSWMGHSSITMTQRYLADAEGQVQQQGINDVFGGGKQRMTVASEGSHAVVRNAQG